MWNAGGTPEVLRHKDEVLRRHCEEVGRDQAQIERTLGLKPIIRDTLQEARRAWEEMMALNRTPMSDVDDDDSFWVGTVEQIAERMRASRHPRLHPLTAQPPAPDDGQPLARWIRQWRATGGDPA